MSDPIAPPVPCAPPCLAAPADQLRWFKEEVQPHEPRLRAWLHARFPTVVDLDDLIQETYLRLFRARNAGKLQHPKSYLFTIARNAVLDRFRREKVVSFEPLVDLPASSVLEENTHAIDATDRDQDLEMLTAAIRALPERCREVLILRKHHGLSHREIADRLGLSPHTVNAQITIAMMKCRDYFRARGVHDTHETRR